MADEPDEPFVPTVRILPAMEEKMNAAIAENPEVRKEIKEKVND